jgi:hypothetical protein
MPAGERERADAHHVLQAGELLSIEAEGGSEALRHGVDVGSGPASRSQGTRPHGPQHGPKPRARSGTRLADPCQLPARPAMRFRITASGWREASGTPAPVSAALSSETSASRLGRIRGGRFYPGSSGHDRAASTSTSGPPAEGAKTWSEPARLAIAPGRSGSARIRPSTSPNHRRVGSVSIAVAPAGNPVTNPLRPPGQAAGSGVASPSARSPASPTIRRIPASPSTSSRVRPFGKIR